MLYFYYVCAHFQNANVHYGSIQSAVTRFATVVQCSLCYMVFGHWLITLHSHSPQNVFFFSSWYLVGGGFVFTVKNTPYILVPGTYDHYSLPHWGNLWDLGILNSLNTLLPYKSQLVFHQVKCFKFEAAAVGNFCCALAVHLLTVLSIVQIASIFSFWVQCDPHQYRCALIYKNILFT